MSYNIFYTEVDKNLKTELNARGQAGMRDRSNNALNFMLGKVANVEMTAYESSGSASDPIKTLGGSTVRGSRFQPNEFLSDRSYEQDDINFYKSQEDPAFKTAQQNEQNPRVGRAYTSTKTLTDNSRRVAPFISDVSVNIGDHSFGLLNKATVQIVIPNVERDLDEIESIFLRPGRYVSINIVHPESAIISRDEQDQGILLSGSAIPNDDKLKQLYPGIVTEKLEELKIKARRMNQFRFEGLVTTFNFSYDTDGTVNASLSLTGTSNVYTDLSMFTDATTTKQKADTPKNPIGADGKPIIIESQAADIGSNYTSQFYEQLYDAADQVIANSILTDASEEGLLDKDKVTRAREAQTSADLLLSLDIETTEKLPNSVLTKINFNNSQQNTTNATDHWVLKGEAFDSSARPENLNPPQPNTRFTTSVRDYRYITLAALISFINDRVITVKAKEGEAPPLIVCSDQICTSNYHEQLVSANPEEILLLPKDPSIGGDMNSYGVLKWYKNIIQQGNNITKEWPGIYSTHATSNNEERTLIYPSRILINLSVINEIVTSLSSKGRESYDIKNFLANVSAKIKSNTGGAIDMKLVSHPVLQSQLLFTDVKNIQPVVDPNKQQETVEPYSVPMFANHPNGTICHSFNFNASLPENAKNLAYVLNSSDDVSESDIAPFLNFMYTAGSRDASKVNDFLERYEKKHLEKLEALVSAKMNYGQDPTSEEAVLQLKKSLYEYLKFPKNKILDSQQVTAPVFPFETEFTIDGINGLRYGDVLTFKALPERYKVNTVFSIIGINHNVTTAGFWTTTVKCIMRPNIQ
jgi:hypothetical protein